MAIVLLMSFKGDVLAQGSADIMHKARGLQKQDLLLTVFGRTLSAVKKGDWRAVSEAINEMNDSVEDYKEHFDIDLKPRLEKVVSAKNPNLTLKYFAQVIYFGMKMEFKEIVDGKIGDYLDSKTKLNRAKGYYIKILSGNVKRKNPKVHHKILGQFILAEAALGHPWIDIALPEVPSNLKAFEDAIKNIEKELTTVYTYFMGKE